MAVYVTNSKEETVALGARLAQALQTGPSLVLFTGGLGAGKTAMCEGIAAGLHCSDPVSSPTFSIVNVYQGARMFAHFDLYRITCAEDLDTAGFFEYLDAGAVVAAEWSENATAWLEHEPAVRVSIERTGETQRRITIEGATAL